MSDIGDFADEFIRQARGGEHPTIRVPAEYVEAFLRAIEPHVRFAVECLERIEDANLRRIIQGIFFPTAAGASIGAAIGFVYGGPAGANVGLVAGGAAGMAIGCIGVMVLLATEDRGPDGGPELVFSVR